MGMKVQRRIKRGEIYFATLEGKGSVQDGVRTVIICSNDLNNNHSPTVNVIPMTTKIKKLCVHVLIDGFGLKKPSNALIEQITTIDKTQLLDYIGVLNEEYISRIDKAIDVQLGKIPLKQIEEYLCHIKEA